MSKFKIYKSGVKRGRAETKVIWLLVLSIVINSSQAWAGKKHRKKNRNRTAPAALVVSTEPQGEGIRSDQSENSHEGKYPVADSKAQPGLISERIIENSASEAPEENQVVPAGGPSYGKKITSAAFCVLSTVGIVTCMHYFQDRENFKFFPTLFSGMGGSYLMSGMVTPHIQNFMGGVKNLAKYQLAGSRVGGYFGIGTEKDIQTRYLRAWELLAVKKRWLSDRDYKELESRLATISQMIESSEGILRLSTPEQIDITLRTIEKALSLPTSVMVITPEAVADMRQDLDSLLKDYPLDVQQALVEFASGVIAASRVPAKPISPQDRDPISRKFACYLQGPPGVGKTRLAKYLARMLGLPYKEVNLRTASSSDLLGDTNFYFSGNSSKEPQVGSLAEILSEKSPDGEKYLNCILFVDEADKQLNKVKKADQKLESKFSEEGPTETMQNPELMGNLLKLLEPREVRIRNAPLGRDLDISRLIVIAAGNEPLENDAIRSRFRTIAVPGYDRDKKAKIFPRLVARALRDHPSLKLGREDDLVFGEMLAKDCSEGVRTLERVIEAYFNSKEVDAVGLSLVEKRAFDVGKAIEGHGGKLCPVGLD